MPTPTKTIAVVNSSSRQAASFIRIAAAVGYRVRAQLRNLDGIVASEISCLSNVTVLVGDLYIRPAGSSDGNGSPTKAGVRGVNHGLIEELYKGAQLAFINTTFWGDEVAIGCALADAAVKANIEHYIYSSMPNHSLHNPTWPSLPLWSSKHTIESYIRTSLSLSLLPKTTFLYTGIYNNNFTSLPYPLFCTELQPDGSFTWTAPFHPDVPLPWLDAEHDVGPAVLQIFKDGVSNLGEGKTIPLAYEMLSPREACRAFARGVGRPVRYHRDAKIEVKVKISNRYREQLVALEEMYALGAKDWKLQPPYFGDEVLEAQVPDVAIGLWEGYRGLEEYAREVFPLEESANGLTWMNDLEEEEEVQGGDDADADADAEEDDDEEEDGGLTIGGGFGAGSRVQDFMIPSTAFSTFRENPRGFVRQDFMSKVNSLIRKLTPRLERSASKLNLLARELAFIPPNEIWLLFEENLGLSNKLKSMIEDLTHQTWEWWPLKPCRRPLSAGNARLFWNCPCGEVRWEDVPLHFAKRFGKLLKQATNSLSTQATPSAPYSDSTTQAANSGTGMQLNPLDRHSLGLIQNQHGYTSHNNPRANLATSTDIATRTARDLQSLPTTYVLLGVTVGSDIRLAQIEVRDVSHITDDHFFKELRYRYTTLRGLMRRWFSIYRYAHCHFVKFEKIGDNEIVPRDEDSIPDPEDLMYQYTPKPIEHMPPITEHEFRRRFYACYNRCSRSKIILLSAFHRCGRVCRQAQVLSRIPKKIWRLEENGDTREIFWGILAMEDISFLMVSIYHFLILVPGFIFWFLWLFYWGHSGDLQNASVPFLALLACLPLFWFPLVVKTK